MSKKASGARLAVSLVAPNAAATPPAASRGSTAVAAAQASAESGKEHATKGQQNGAAGEDVDDDNQSGVDTVGLDEGEDEGGEEEPLEKDDIVDDEDLE